MATSLPQPNNPHRHPRREPSRRKTFRPAASRDVNVCALFRRCIRHRRDEDWYELHRRYGRRIRMTVMRATRTQPETEIFDELMQELYLRLLSRDVSRFCGNTGPELWAYIDRMARNLARDRRRHSEAKKRGGRSRIRFVDSRELEKFAARESLPEDRVLAREGIRLFLLSCRQAARGTQEELKLHVVRLAFLEGLSSREIAEALPENITPNQVDCLIHRLRHQLAQDGVRLGRRHLAA